MIRSRRCLSAPELGAHHEIVAWVERHARLHAVFTQGIVCDDWLLERAFDRADPSARSLVTLVLEGRLYLQSGGRTFRCDAGSGLHLPTKGILAARTEGDRYRSLVLEWEPGHAGDAMAFHFEVAPLLPLASSLLSAAAPDASILKQILSAVGSFVPTEGIDFRLDALPEAKELRAQEIADALDLVLSSLSSQPMATDLESRLGVSGRQVTRQLAAFRERYGYGSANWQDARTRRRIMLAAAFATAPSASVADIAQLVGYGHPETLSRAFLSAGLPPPSRIRSEIERLGAAWNEGSQGRCDGARVDG